VPRKAATKVRADEAQAIDIMDVLAMVNGKYGADTMRVASDPVFKITRVPTGILALDAHLKGGFTRGRHIELYGMENVGKTTIAYSLAASVQELGGTAAMCDLEGTLDPKYAESLGVDLARFPVTRQDKSHAEQALDIVELAVRRASPDVMIIDTIAALLPKAEYEKALSEDSFGTDQARLMSKALRKLTAANKTTIYVWINQTRQIVGASVFAKQTTTSGGRAMGFYAATRIELVRTELIKSPSKKINPRSGESEASKRAVGHRVLCRITKDKTGSARPDLEVPLVYDYRTQRFDPLEDLIYCGRVAGLIKKSGNSWWVVDYEDEKQASRSKFKGWVRRNRAVRDELVEAIMGYFTEKDDNESEDD